MTDGYAFSHDPERCIKCFSCETACKQWRDIPPATYKLRRVYEVATGSFPQVTRTFHSEACRHCPDAPCVDACPPSAIMKRAADGLVVVDGEKCDGCRKCLDACPFGVPAFDGDGVMQLCDLCLERRAQSGRPVCSDACPTGALTYKGPAPS